MKPFLGIDITENKKNETFNGEEFILAVPEQANTAALERAGDAADDLLKQIKLPLPLRIVQWIGGAGGALLTIGLLRALADTDGVTFAEAYANAGWLFWVAGGCLAAWLILTLAGYKKQNTVLQSENTDRILSGMETLSANILAELGVPADAAEVDVLVFTYKMKNGEPVARERGMNPTPYAQLNMRAFVKDAQLCLATLDGLYAFPMSELRAIRTVNKHISTLSWNKDDDPDKGIYKPYKMTVDQYGCVHFKPYHILEIEHMGTLWGIYFPCYELPTMEKLTGLHAEAK